MISLTLKDTKQFMSHLLVKDTFDTLWLSQADIATANTVSIDGKVNKAYYSASEWEELSEKKYASWAQLKPICFELIKGNKVPSSMKIVLLLSDIECEQLLSTLDGSISITQINGLFWNIRYIDGAVAITTGTSLNFFTLDKTLESSFDAYTRRFLEEHHISYEES